MTGMGWAICGVIALVALQFFAIALTASFDNDPPRPVPRRLTAPSNVTRTRREEGAK